MLLFWFASVVALLIVLLVLWSSIKRYERSESDLSSSPLAEGEQAARQAMNVRIYQKRLAELKSDLAEGFIDDQQYQHLVEDLSRNLLTETEGADDVEGGANALTPHIGSRSVFVLVLIGLVSLLSCVLYLKLGEGQKQAEWLELKAGIAPVLDTLEVGGRLTEEQLQAHSLPDLIRALQARVQANPENAQNWHLLGISYSQLQMEEQALTSLKRAAKQEPRHIDYGLDYLRYLFQKNKQQLDPVLERAFRRFLRYNPDQPAALQLFGLAAFQSQRYDQAIEIWTRALQQEGLQGRGRVMISRGVDIARERLASGGEVVGEADQASVTSRVGQGSDITPIKPKQPDDSPQAQAAVLNVLVDITPELAAKVQATDTLFVFAKAQQGPPMPLAVKRIESPSFPLRVELSDADAMMPAMTLSKFAEVVVTARLSKHGTVDARAGDLEAEAISTSNNASLSLQLNQER